MPTTGILSQEQRWASYFTPLAPISLGPVIKKIVDTVPSVIQLQAAGSQQFETTIPTSTFPFALVQPAFTDSLFLGQQLAGAYLLVPPEEIRAIQGTVFAVATGDITIPDSAANATVGFTLFQNYFSNGVGTTGTLAQIPSQSVISGKHSWSLVCRLVSQGNGNYQGLWTMTLDTQPFSGTLSVSGPSRPLQLSLQVIFGGAIGGSDVFRATSQQWELQRKPFSRP